MELTHVVIGIQARMTSERLPGKSLELIGEKPMIKHVIDACQSAANYMNLHQIKTKRMVSVAVLVPEGDELVNYLKHYAVKVVEGPEHDVLTRYQIMADAFNANYVVRITADCPEMQDPIIVKAVTTAVMNRYDYTSNVDERFRSAPDGLDVEVFSRALLNYACDKATDKYDREHVTTFMRRELPAWASQGFIAHREDRSSLKLSVDTIDDLEAARSRKANADMKYELAQRFYGKKNVHRF